MLEHFTTVIKHIIIICFVFRYLFFFFTQKMIFGSDIAVFNPNAEKMQRRKKKENKVVNNVFLLILMAFSGETVKSCVCV